MKQGVRSVSSKEEFKAQKCTSQKRKGRKQKSVKASAAALDPEDDDDTITCPVCCERGCVVMHCRYAVIPGIMQNVLTFLQMITTSEAYSLISLICQPFVLVWL